MRLSRRNFIRSIAGATAAGPLVQLASATPDFSMIFMGDRHVSDDTTAANFTAVTDWAVANKTTKNIKGVFAAGDLGLDLWNYAGRGKGWINLHDAGIPWGSAIGNHDYGGATNLRYGYGFDLYVTSHLSGETYWGGYWTGEPNGWKNSYYLKFAVGSRQFLVLFLEFFPRTDCLTWATGILNANPSREVIVVTHGYMTSAGDLAPRSSYGPDNYSFPDFASAGADIEAWAAGFANIRAILCGHWITGAHSAHRTDTGTHGNPLHGIYINYQDVYPTPGAYLLLEFTATQVTVSNLGDLSGAVENTYPPYTLVWASSSTALWPLPCPRIR